MTGDDWIETVKAWDLRGLSDGLPFLADWFEEQGRPYPWLRWPFNDLLAYRGVVALPFRSLLLLEFMNNSCGILNVHLVRGKEVIFKNVVAAGMSFRLANAAAFPILSQDSCLEARCISREEAARVYIAYHSVPTEVGIVASGLSSWDFPRGGDIVAGWGNVRNKCVELLEGLNPRKYVRPRVERR